MKEYEIQLETICPVFSEIYGSFIWFNEVIPLTDDNGCCFGDNRCRWVGARVLISEYKEANAWSPERYPAGTWTVRIQQTRSGVEFGANQPEYFFKSSAEVLAHVKKYFKMAKARAKRKYSGDRF